MYPRILQPKFHEKAMFTNFWVPFPSYIRRENASPSIPLDTKFRIVRCYYKASSFVGTGLSNYDHQGDVMEGCGECVIPHPDDELQFSERWIMTRNGVKRNAFIEVTLPEEWMKKENKWVRSQTSFEDYYS